LTTVLDFSETPTPQGIKALTHRFKFVSFFTEFNSSFGVL
jgi:hypothetical protein